MSIGPMMLTTVNSRGSAAMMTRPVTLVAVHVGA